MAIYDHRKIERRWQKRWKEQGIYQPFGLAPPFAKATEGQAPFAKASRGEPFYNLMMFPYPSAEGLHVGNMYAFTGADVYGRYQRMQGKEVFQPIGLDGFGIHSENYALSIGKHPAEQAAISEKRFYDQLAEIGNGFSWDQKLETYDPDYYRWTQWLFVKMFKHGLAVRKMAMVNWCPTDKTVLADEQVEGGVCERCKNPVERRQMAQWFFRITEYAERLLGNIDGSQSPKSLRARGSPEPAAKVQSQKFGPAPKDYDPKRYGLRWPEKIKAAQRNWIGRSEGVEIDWEILGPRMRGRTMTTFTTRLDTIFGATFLVLSPDHPLVSDLATDTRVRRYVQQALLKTEQERKAGEREKTGVQTAYEARHPLTGKPVPIWIADFVLLEYGTGAIMGVPAHDERDFAFAKKFGLPVMSVVDVDGKEVMDQAVTGYGMLVNSGKFDGLSSEKAMPALMRVLEKEKRGRAKTAYHLRDWLISRQRYWGPPIPMIFCQQCAKQGKTFKGESFKGMEGWWPVPEEELPVRLPEMSKEDVMPRGDGKSPLERAPESWLFTKCPSCGEKAKRETDVSDTFLDSSWYFLAYPNLGTKEWAGDEIKKRTEDQKTQKTQKARKPDEPEHQITRTSGPLELRNSDSAGSLSSPSVPILCPFNTEVTRRWLPVDAYIGGAEHAVLHLLYSRFVTMALHDWGYLDFEEPFPFLYSHGLIIKDGAKMSKSRGNVVIPDQYISKFGSDALRIYLMFLGRYDQGGDFRDTGIAGMYRFLNRVWRLYQERRILRLPGSSHRSRRAQDDLVGLKSLPTKSSLKIGEKTDEKLVGPLHRTVKKVTEDISAFRFNTAIASIMKFINTWEDGGSLSWEDAGVFLKLLAPFCPHQSEELWQEVKRRAVRPGRGWTIRSRSRKASTVKGSGSHSIHLGRWPTFDERLTAFDTVEIVVQVDGKLAGRVVVPQGEALNREIVMRMVLREPKVVRTLEGRKIKKTIWVEGKLVNYVTT